MVNLSLLAFFLFIPYLGQLTANSFETTTVSNKAVQQGKFEFLFLFIRFCYSKGLTMQSVQGWQPNRLVDQRQQDINQIPTDQRKTLGMFIADYLRC
jgi:hypothetical protein